MAAKAEATLPDLWASALEAVNDNQNRRSDSREAFVYVVGPTGSGKSSLVSSCMLASADTRRTSAVVDFAWVQRANALGKHDSACIWELPGTEALAHALVTKQKGADALLRNASVDMQATAGAPLPAFFLPAKSINTAVVVVAVDLTTPVRSITALLQWLDHVRNALGAQYSLLERRGSQLPAQLRARAARVSAAVTGGEAPALERVDFPGIQVVICATKFDRVRSQPLEKNEAVARALRYIAHANGAHLLYSAGGGTASGRRDAEAADMQAKLRVLLAHAMFAGYDRRLPVESIKTVSRAKAHPELAAEAPLCVLHGTDSFERIGTPPSVPHPEDVQQAWLARVRELLPDEPTQPDIAADLEALPSDAGVDSVVAQLRRQADAARPQDVAAAKLARC